MLCYLEAIINQRSTYMEYLHILLTDINWPIDAELPEEIYIKMSKEYYDDESLILLRVEPDATHDDILDFLADEILPFEITMEYLADFGEDLRGRAYAYEEINEDEIPDDADVLVLE